MKRLFRSAGYAALVATPSALLVRTLLAPATAPVAELWVGGGLLFVGAVTVGIEQERVFDGIVEWEFDAADVADVVAIVIAAGITYALSVHAGLGPVVSSALVGLGAGLWLPEVDTAAYCGSFVGMVSPTVFPSVTPVLVAGLLAGVAFVAARGTFTGVGGRLGTLALFGCLTAGVVTGVDYAPSTTLPWTSIVFVVPVTVVGAVATVVASTRFGLGPVVASALVGIVAGVSLPAVLPTLGSVLASAAYCSSFVGMSSTERLETEASVGLAGVLCGVVFVAVAPAFAGAGGKLGTTAFVACLTGVGATELSTTREVFAR
ncbi:hypothetical protein [Haloarchaeobius sp. TZWSO28]|uniref:hypothetical protein n=1 Tax=Haloarchaeobius sp. TZWSO28 TaxID=3446119 RepID=UPI003EB7D8D6